MAGKSLVPAFADRPLPGRPARLGARTEPARSGSAGGSWWRSTESRGSCTTRKPIRIELTDLAAKRPEQVAELAAKWEAWAKLTNVLPYPTPRKKG
ncbi:MAG: hypothetical protein U0736_00855 [Gemmataceae bacterium]